MRIGSDLATVRTTVSWGVTARDRAVIAAFYGLQAVSKALRPGKGIGHGLVPNFWLGDLRVRTPAGDFLCRRRTTDFDIINPRFEGKVLDLLERALGRLVLAPSSSPAIFVDVGAHIGKYPVFVGQRFRGRVRTAAFEPDPDNFHLLEANLQLNGCGELTRAFNEACGSYNGFGQLRRNTEGKPHDEAIAPLEPMGPSKAVATVPVARLDDALTRHGLSPASVLKIDVQGGEMEVLRGAERTISDPRLHLVILEDDGDPERSGPLTYLRERGFVISRIDERNCAATRAE